MSNVINARARGISRWGVSILLLLALLTGGLAFARFAHIRPVDDSSTSSPPIIGISIGNSHSSVGVKRNGTIHIIPDKHGSLTIPSVVSFTDTGEVLVGQDAVEILLSHPERSITGFKRLLGRTYEEVGDFVNDAHYKIVERNGTPAIEVSLESESKVVYPTEIAALVIKKLKSMAEGFLGEEIKEAVTALREAASIAGLDVVRVVNEPTAAALAYDLASDYYQESITLAYNLDGTAFEASVVAIDTGVYEVLSTVRNENVSSNGIDVSPSQLARLHSNFQGLQDEDNVGRGFSDHRKDQVSLTSTESGNDKTITKEDSDYINSFNVNQAVKVVDQAIRDANITIYDITDIIPSGDLSRMPKLRSLILERFPSTPPVHETIDPRFITTYGGAMQGSIMHGEDDTGCGCSVDVTSWSLGVETGGGIMSTVVKRLNVVPTQKSNIFTTTTDNQTSVAVTVFKGQRDFVQNNFKLGSLEIDGLIPAPRGVPEIEVTFEVDHERYTNSLKVSVTDRGRKKTKSLFVESSQLQPHTKGEAELIEAHLEEWEKCADEERILRDATQKRIIQGGDGTLETTKGIIERALLN
ncbi:heat shock protein 70 [Karstenula rhodostoma CBS 690.94]|uniref:Heat shock protein 70 n=1 Tax=Karstenula rhodostoma CBS 690.94 TaxID=1392251 RepID=A0A9P4P832_9PLEO|nr:heat shock protein 70 [Karstenula rhodostoma CBS 690.94]